MVSITIFKHSNSPPSSLSIYLFLDKGFNQVTIWDDIIQNKSQAKINHRQKAPEYPLTDMQKTLE